MNPPPPPPPPALCSCLLHHHRLLRAVQPPMLTAAAASLEGYPVLLKVPPPFEKSNIGQKGRPNYPVSLITAVNGRVISTDGFSLTSFNQHMDKRMSRGSGTEHAWLIS